MKVLIVGSGGREHALAWKISQSTKVKKLYCAPGNGGIGEIAENVSLKDSDIQGLRDFASKEKIDLTVVGPEVPLTHGIVDEFEKKGLKIFGPHKSAAQLEGSKVFAKNFMQRHKIPTPGFKIADSPQQGYDILNSGEFSFPLVVKADGLASGKGALVCRNLNKAQEAVHSLMEERKFGKAGKRVVIEEFLRGKEASFMVISDGVKVIPMVTTMDHKAAFDGDKGPNTGGMGAISPSPFIDQEMYNQIIKSIIFPTVTRMLEEGRKYKGVLYAGLMLTEEGPKVLEYNCRFGDPETQPQVLRMESDLVDVLAGAVDEKVLESEMEWNHQASGCVVVASGGYPIKYEKGKEIKGLDKVTQDSGVVVFHAGTRKEGQKLLTDGGRVLGVGASEKSLKETMNKIYRALSHIDFEAMHFRRDIGAAREEG
ncbi:phosphoribosylamine--glycine ligase [bacterium]|nr:phosphoribosylamine--glycine ligase [bacterium]